MIVGNGTFQLVRYIAINTMWLLGFLSAPCRGVGSSSGRSVSEGYVTGK